MTNDLFPNTQVELADTDNQRHLISSTGESWCENLNDLHTQTWHTSDNTVNCPDCLKEMQSHLELAISQ